jgi:hypothetical protein
MDQLELLIRLLIYEAKDQRYDGWTKESYRERLEKLKKLIDKALE